MTMDVANHPDRQITVDDDKGFIAAFETLFGEISPREVQKRKFLNAMCRTGRVMAACKLSDTHKSSYQYWMQHDEKFQAAMEAAREVAGEMLLEVAYDRAINGTPRFRPQFYEGVEVGGERWTEFDNKLLWQLVQANAGQGVPEHYKQKQKVELTGHITHLHELAEGAVEDQQDYDKRIAESKINEERTVDAEVREV